MHHTQRILLDTPWRPVQKIRVHHRLLHVFSSSTSAMSILPQLPKPVEHRLIRLLPALLACAPPALMRQMPAPPHSFHHQSDCSGAPSTALLESLAAPPPLVSGLQMERADARRICRVIFAQFPGRHTRRHTGETEAAGTGAAE